MKKKKREKSMVNGQDGLIWMKGMEDILNLKINSTKNSDKETNNSANSNKKLDLIEICKEPKNITNALNNKHNYYDELKDKEDYLNVHKMYLDLDTIQREEEEQTVFKETNKEEDESIENVDMLTRDFSLLTVINEFELFYFFF